MSRSGDAAFAAARALIAALVGRGLAGAVISPGSRSTPLALACARHDGLDVRVVLDERSAAFTALGLAKATGRPAAAVCTSGTAAANHLPAAVEATMSRTPLLLLTADRPPELRGSGANQTIDQRNLLGVHARYLDGGDAEDWHALGIEAFDAAMGPPAAAVQVNLPFDEPLVPSADGALPDPAPPWSPPARRAAALPPGVAEHERGVVVAGCLDRPAPAIAALADALGWPLLAEPISNLQGLTAAEALVADDAFVGRYVPEVVVQVGTTPTTRAMQRFVARAQRLIVADPDGRRQDPTARAEMLVAEPASLRVPAPRAPGAWLDSWRRADVTARAALDAGLDAGFGEARIARDVALALPDGAELLVGNSGPVRDLALGMRPRATIRVHANRGASGIDGMVSTAFGLAWGGRPTVALIGDLTFLHDLGGFAWGARAGLDITFVVVNNGGGRIFDRLPTAGLPEHEALFVTPHRGDLGALAGAAGARHVRVGGPDALAAALAAALGTPGTDVVEAIPAAQVR